MANKTILNYCSEKLLEDANGQSLKSSLLYALIELFSDVERKCYEQNSLNVGIGQYGDYC